MAALDGVSAPCQTLLRLLIADPPLSYDEISAVLDMPKGSIGPTRQRCLVRLRAVLATLQAPCCHPSSTHDRHRPDRVGHVSTREVAGS